MIEYKKQHNKFVKLNKRCKKNFFENIELKNNSKPFWSTCKTHFFNKHVKSDTDILFIENNKILLDSLN